MLNKMLDYFTRRVDWRTKEGLWSGQLQASEANWEQKPI
jgi:hypothetical protein